MIEKVIHYCWFGNGPKSKLVLKCLNSWKKFCPHFKIIEWNESNFCIENCQYAKEAFLSKKWAFVSDYARFKILSEHGGIYLDTDVELIKPIDELLFMPFMGFETPDHVNPGSIIACGKHDYLCEKMIEQYENDNFIIDGVLNQKTVCERVTDILAEEGLILNNSTQHILGYMIYNNTYFSPRDFETGKIDVKESTYLIHHCEASWVSAKDKIRGGIYRLIYKLFGAKFAKKIQQKVGRKKK